jgi:dTDP-4-amino-4,6-dideoxygalactose transaminase
LSWEIPLTAVEITDEDIDAVLACLESGWLTMGPRTQQLEAAFAELYGVPHAVAVSSGTAALHLALLAAGVGPGDEVLVPAMTFVAAAGAVRYCGATPVFVESLGAHDFNLDPADAARLVGPRTRAVLATHWMGYACDTGALEELCSSNGLVLIEDCAQSITATCADGRLTGTVGAVGCFSFFSKKQLTVGEGGMLVSSSEALAAKARSLRSHAMTSVTWDRHRGHAEGYDIVDLGFNYRLDEPRAALGLSRLPRLGAHIEHRRTVVKRYRELLDASPEVIVPWSEDEVERSSHFGFPIVLGTAELRTRVERELDARGVQTTCYPALTALSAYSDHPRRPVAEDLAARHLVLPLSSTSPLTEAEIVVGRLLEVLSAGRPLPTR